MIGRPNRKGFARLLRGTAVLLVLLGGLLAGLRATLPWLATRVAEKASLRYLGLPLEIGNVDFVLRRGEVVLENVRVNRPAERAGEKRPADGISSVLEISRVALRWSWSDLLRKRLTVASLTVADPALRVLRKADGTIDLPMRTAPNSGPPSASEASAASPQASSWPVEVRSVSVLGPKVLVTDTTDGKRLLEFSLESFELDRLSVTEGNFGVGSVAVRAPQMWMRKELVHNEAAGPRAATSEKARRAVPSGRGFRIKAVDMQRAKLTWEGKDHPLDVFLTLKVSGVTDEVNRQFPLEMSVRIGSGELKLAGEAGISPPFFQGKVAWHDLAFPPLLLAVRPDLVDWLQSASSSGKIDLVLDSAGLRGSPGLHVSGRTSLENLSAAAPGSNRVTLGCRRLDLEITRLDCPLPANGTPVRPIVADIATLRADTPWLVYAHPASFWEILGKGDEPFLAEVSLGRLEVGGGDIKLQDTTVSATSVVSDLAVIMDSARYPDLTCGSLSVHATVAADSRFSLEGSVQPGWTGDFRLALRDLHLPAWNPYARNFGISLDAGTVSIQTRLAFSGPALEADNEVTFRWVDVSFPNSGVPALGMPVHLAIALLRDPAGEITLSVPVRRDGNGATVGRDAVITSALRAAILGALSSPLKVLNGGGTKAPGAATLSIPPFACGAGSADPGRDAPARVRKIARLLAERPEISFTIAGRSGPADRTALAGQRLVDLARDGEKLPRVKDAGFLAMRRIGIFLAKRAKGESAVLAAEDLPLFERLVAAVDVPRNQLDALANQRAETLKALFVEKGVSASRLRVEKPAVDGEAGVLLAFPVPEPKKAPRRTGPSGT